MSDQPDQSEKTEDPSHRKLEEAKKKGDVPKSQEVTTWFTMLGGTLLTAIMLPTLASGLGSELKKIIANADQVDIGGNSFGMYFNGLAYSILGVALLPLGLMMLMGVAGNMVQHQPLLSTEPIKPKLQKISPLAGAKRLFSTDALVNFAKGLLKLAVVSVVLFAVLWPERDRLEMMITADPAAILWIIQELAIKVFAAVLAIVTIIAAADLAYQRYKWWNKQKMTVKEVRDEYKQAEGDPHVKGRIRQLRHERARKRMMAAVPSATVVVANPTHYAVALKYDSTMNAPICVAKGIDAVALRIRGLAEDSDVPVVENPPLARTLYAAVEVDQTIPPEHFKAVAQLIGYVMRLQNKRKWRN